MPKVKLIALDMDGTLLDSRKQPPRDFVDWVQSHEDIAAVLASGRQYATLRQQFPAICDRLSYIADNGAFVFHKGEMIFSNEMNHAGTRQCLKAFEAIPGCHVVLCGRESAFMRPDRADVFDNISMYYKSLVVTPDLEGVIESGCIGKAAILVDDRRAEEVYRRLPALHPDFKVMLSGAEWLDVSNADVGKGSGVAALQKALGITRDESMAFGDYLNDCELLAAVTESYAMGNAHESLKAMAKHIADTNDNDGVMKILRGL